MAEQYAHGGARPRACEQDRREEGEIQEAEAPGLRVVGDREQANVVTKGDAHTSPLGTSPFRDLSRCA